MRIAVTWSMCGYIDVPGASTYEEAIAEVLQNADDYNLPVEQVYVDGSFEPSTQDPEEMAAICKF